MVKRDFPPLSIEQRGRRRHERSCDTWQTMTAQAAKLSQKAASYQKSPKGKLRCDNCTLFQAPTACKSVEGPVAAPGWCSIYVAM